VGPPSPRYVESRETAIALNDQEILEAQSLTGSFAVFSSSPQRRLPSELLKNCVKPM
jgi:hypothetical protein